MFNILLKELRAKKGMTQAQLAKAIGVSPVSYTHLTLPTIA